MCDRRHLAIQVKRKQQQSIISTCLCLNVGLTNRRRVCRLQQCPMSQWSTVKETSRTHSNTSKCRKSLWLFVNNRLSHSVFKLSQDSQTKHAKKTPSKGRDWTRVICSSEFNLVESLERFYSRIIPWWDKSRTREKQAEKAVTCGQDEVSRDHSSALFMTNKGFCWSSWNHVTKKSKYYNVFNKTARK